MTTMYLRKQRFGNGVLHGYTIVRFSHGFANGGGVENYINDLDNELLERNDITIVRMYLSRIGVNEKKSEERIGKGKLVKYPMKTRKWERTIKGFKPYCFDKSIEVIKEIVRDRIMYNPLLRRVFLSRIVKMKTSSRSLYEASNICKEIKEVLTNYNPNLVVMHDIGKNDSFQVVTESIAHHIPFVVINHYSNDRFAHISVREQTRRASGVGGVTGVGVPKWLQNGFVNLADGIDADFFDENFAKPVNIKIDAPVVILPARIISSKGQTDLIEAIWKIKKEGVEVWAVFAGRTDSAEYEAELKHKISILGLQNQVFFLGNLTTEVLRDWYNASSVMAFPTYHHEGLPRILMETQAMKVPPVAYEIGGIQEGIIDGKTGYLLKKGDIDGLANKIKNLVLDKDKLEKMGESGRQFIKKQFSLQALAARHEEFYLHAIKSRKNS